jgi:hypothetical protein
MEQAKLAQASAAHVKRFPSPPRGGRWTRRLPRMVVRRCGTSSTTRREAPWWRRRTGRASASTGLTPRRTRGPTAARGGAVHDHVRGGALRLVVPAGEADVRLGQGPRVEARRSYLHSQHRSTRPRTAFFSPPPPH